MWRRGGAASVVETLFVRLPHLLKRQEVLIEIIQRLCGVLHNLSRLGQFQWRFCVLVDYVCLTAAQRDGLQCRVANSELRGSQVQRDAAKARCVETPCITRSSLRKLCTTWSGNPRGPRRPCDWPDPTHDYPECMGPQSPCTLLRGPLPTGPTKFLCRSQVPCTSLCPRFVPPQGRRT